MEEPSLSPKRTTYAEKFELLLDMFPHPDRREHEDPARRRWRGVELSEATHGKLSSGYITGLKNGRIKRPGPDHLRLLASIMGFPFELWLTEPHQWPAKLQSVGILGVIRPDEGSRDSSVAARTRTLFESIVNPDTNEPYDFEEVAERSGGQLTAEEVEQIASGEISNPTRSQLLNLCDVFEVDFSYWDERKDPLLNHETIDALRSDKGYALLQKSLGLSDDKMDMVLVLMEQLDSLESSPTDWQRGS